MPRDLSSLFVEETTKSQQSRLFKLVTVELYKSSKTGSMTAADNILYMNDASELLVGQEITVYGAGLGGKDATFKITDININNVTLNSNAATTVSNATVFYTVILRICDSNYDLVYDGLTYLRFPLKVSDMSISSDGSIDKASLTIANVSRDIMYYVEKYDGLRNRMVTIKAVYEKFLDNLYVVDEDGSITITSNPDKNVLAYLEDSFIIDSYSATEEVVTFSLNPAIDLEIKLPTRNYSASCSFDYRGIECGFSGAEPSGQVGCNKLLSGCKARNNTARFGGFIGLVSNRRIFF